MPKTSLPEALRYLFSGFVGFFYLFAYDSGIADTGLAKLGPLGLTASLLVISTLFYFLYRAFLYNLVVVPLQNVLRWKSDNYRTYLARSYAISWSKADFLFIQVRELHLVDRYQVRAMDASGIHFLYMAAVLALPFGILHVAGNDLSSASFFFIAFVVFGVGGFLLDRRYESAELAMLKMLPSEQKSQIDELAQQLFDTTRTL